MSSQSTLSEHINRQIPELGIRKTTFKAESIHRQDPDSDDPRPDCRENIGEDEEFMEVRPDKLLQFSRWHLCRDCFPDQEGSR